MPASDEVVLVLLYSSLGVTSGIRKRIDDIVMHTMDIGLRDVLNDTLVVVKHPRRGLAFHPIDLMNSMTVQGWAPV